MYPQMSRHINRLNAAKVRTITRPGRYADGAGLWLQVDAIRRSWLFRYTFGGRTRKIGLGPVATLGLADARVEAQKLHAKLRDGIDPLAHRRATRAAQHLDQLKSITFSQAALKYIASHSAGWKNLKHANQWTQSLKAHADAIIGTIAGSGHRHRHGDACPRTHLDDNERDSRARARPHRGNPRLVKG